MDIRPEAAVSGALNGARPVLVLIPLLFLLAPARARADQLEVHGLVQLWATRALDAALTSASREVPPNSYYDLRNEFRADTFSVRRAEIALSGRLARRAGFRVMADAAIAAGNANVLQDAIVWVDLADGLVLRAGQMKTLQTYEGVMSSAQLALAERGQLTRRFGDVRDRGVTLSWDRAGGRPIHLAVGVFNGAGKADDENSRKDAVFRAEWAILRKHRIGAYGLRGSTDQPLDRAVALDFAGESAPSAAGVRTAADATSQGGAFYVFEGNRVGAAFEFLTGRVGRRHPSLGVAPAPATREHLDQRLVGLQVTLDYKLGAHALAARYDRLDYNAGRHWYSGHNPYRESAPGVALRADVTPVFTELSLGYTLALDPENRPAASLRVNYIKRQGTFLLSPAAGSGAWNGATVVAALQAAF